MIKEEIKIAQQQDQLLTKEGALKMAGISNATFLKAINEASPYHRRTIVIPTLQLIHK